MGGTGMKMIRAILMLCVFLPAAEAQERNMPNERDSLWDMTDVRKQPLGVEVVGTRRAPLFVARKDDWMNTGDAWVAKKEETASAVPASAAGNEQLIVEELFFSSESTPDGPNRIFCAVARPEKAAGPVPVVLVFHGGGGHASGALAVATARRHPGMAAVAMDYNGQFRPGPEGKVTRWKNVTRERRFNLVPDLTNWPMYHNVIAARRTIDLIEIQPWADKDRIGAVGISYGGWVALILAGVDERVKCVTTAVSASGAGFTAGRSAQQLRWEPAEQRRLWLDHYEPLAYAADTKAAVFFQLATNDLFFWLNGAAKNLAALPGNKGWVLRPNSNHGAGGPTVPGAAAPALMRHVLAGGPPLPRITDFQVSDNGLRYTWKVQGPRPIRRSVLNWSPGKAVSPARYWIELPATRDGDVWSANVPAELGKLTAETFVNAGDEDGIVVSSMLLSHGGLDPMTQPGPQWPGGQLWDTERGAAAWRTPAGWLPKTAFEVSEDGGLQVGPDEGGREFILLTNSVILASGVASQHSGVRVEVNGNGQSGTLKITLLRDTNSLDEIRYTASREYGAGTTHLNIRWDEFKPSRKTSGGTPWPFDGLLVEGERAGGVPLTLKVIAFLD